MKKILTLSAATFLAAGTLMATQYDIWLSGSTAFRNNAYDAASKLFDNGAPASILNDGTSPANKSTYWAMSGTMTNILGAGNTATVVVHGTFNGSVAGIFALENPFGVPFYQNASGSVVWTTNTPTAIFSDVDSKTTLYPLSSSSYWEKYVAVQPFAYFKSASLSVAVIQNVAFGQLPPLLNNSAITLAQFTGTNADTNVTVYLPQRTQDSGTRVTTYAEGNIYVAPSTQYYYDPTGGWYVATTNRYTDPLFTAGNFGAGYVGGGDIANVLKLTGANNSAIGYLSVSDGKGITGVNWGNLLAYNGQYPIANYVPGVAPATNDFSPIINGQYSFWAYEVLAWAKSSQYSSHYSDQLTPYSVVSPILNHFANYNGTTTTKGTFQPSGTLGTIDYEVTTNIPPTAISLNVMNVSRSAVGGPIGHN